jgi:glucose/arabinose dehydrogenase
MPDELGKRSHLGALRIALLSLPLFAAVATAPADPPPPSPVFPSLPPARAAALLRQPDVDLFRLDSVTNAGDDRLFLTQQQGLVHVVAGGKLRPEPFLDLRSVVSTGGERGLLALAFHPRYAQNGLFFVLYTDLDSAVVLARYRVSSDPDRADPASGQIVLRVPSKHLNHNGGQVLFGPDGDLYLSLGDGGGEGNTGRDPDCNAQQGTTLLGKILRLDVDHGTPYAIPPDNPFRGNPSMPAEVWAYGLRNPWRFSFDRKTGDLYIGDVGEDRREEIDVEPAGSPGGRNYGWKVMEGTFCFSTDACPATVPPCGSAAYTPPVLEYGHEDDRCSVTGGYVYRGTALPHLHGAYIFGDICNGQLWAAERKGNDWQVHPLASKAQYVTSFGEDRRGELWLTTLDGRLLRLAPAHPVDTVALYDPASARLFVKDLHVSGPEDRSLRLSGQGRGSVPLAGDWDGDGRTTVAFASSGKAGAVPLVGDWDGDGRDTVGLYERATSTFALQSSDLSFRFGPSRCRWVPLSGDWDGDGRDGIGFYDPVRGVFRLKNSLAGGEADVLLRFGPAKSGWLPLVGDWDGDGRDGIGLYAPATSVFLLKNDLDGGPADWEVRFGPPASGRVPLAGEW